MLLAIGATCIGVAQEGAIRPNSLWLLGFSLFPTSVGNSWTPPTAVRLPASTPEEFEKMCGRFRVGANYSSMDVESDPFDAPSPISEADFVRLFARHELALRNYARLILPDWSAVDDVLQDSTITMWESRQRAPG